MTHEYHLGRRSFLKAGGLAGAAIAAGATFAEEARAHGITKGDIAILRVLSAVEQVESDLWQQYNELGGIQDSEEPPSAATRNTPPRCRTSIRICLNISTTIPTTSSATTLSSTHSWLR